MLDYAHDRNVPLPPDVDPLLAMADPLEPATVDVLFDRGVPTGINGVGMPTLDLFESLGTIAMAHNVGRVRGRDLRDAPAAIVLFAAHEALFAAVSSDEQRRSAAETNRQFVALVAEGRWFTPEREALDTALNRANESVTGSVRVKLFKGLCDILEARATAVAPASALTVVRTS